MLFVRECVSLGDIILIASFNRHINPYKYSQEKKLRDSLDTAGHDEVAA